MVRKGVLLFSGLVGLGAFLFFYPFWVLTLVRDGQTVVCQRVQPGDTFELAFRHSIALSDVRDVFSLDSNHRMVLAETRFQGQGAGIPYNLSDGEKLHREGDWFRITGMRRVVPEIFWRVQAQWHNRFRFAGNPEIDLSAKLGDALIRIQTRKITAAAWLKIRLADTPL
jgi:hypothetical protein